MEDRNQILASQSGDFREGVAAFLEKRPPKYTAIEPPDSIPPAAG